MELAGIFSDAKKFIPRLRFEDANANLSYFSQPYSEQVALIDALEELRQRTVLIPGGPPLLLRSHCGPLL